MEKELDDKYLSKIIKIDNKDENNSKLTVTTFGYRAKEYKEQIHSHFKKFTKFLRKYEPSIDFDKSIKEKVSKKLTERLFKSIRLNINQITYSAVNNKGEFIKSKEVSVIF